MKAGCEDRQLVTTGGVPTPATHLPTGIRRSKSSRWRAAALILLNLLMIAHIIQWRITGRTISPIEPSETMHTLQRGAVNAGFIFFSLAILATLIFGRFVCGWGCHILALQDFCAWLMKKVGITPKPFRSRLLVYVPLIAALYMFVWPTAYRLFARGDTGPIIPTFTNHLVTSNFWDTFPSAGVAIPFLFICGFMTVYFLGSKGFCTYACPYGGFFGLADKIAPWKIRVTDACNQCGHCTATCTSNVLVHAEVRDFKMVVDPGCMKCLDCVSVCPNDALYLGFGKPAFAISKSGGAARSFSLTWPEEIAGAMIFLASFFAVRGVYSLVPFLMALGCAAVTTFLALRAWRLVRANELYLHRFNLKSGGAIHAAGWILLVFAIFWLALVAHSGWIRFHEHAGSKAFEKIQVPDELALAQLDPTRWIAPSERENIADGRRHLQAVSRFGLFKNGDALSKLGWFEYLSGNAAGAVDLLGDAANHQKRQAKALSHYYRGAIMNRLGRYQEAEASLNEALAEREDLILARQEKGESLWELGRKDEAIMTWAEAVRRNSDLPLTNNFLSGAKRAQGADQDAAIYEMQADQATPDNALYHWMLGRRLKNVGMDALAEKHFQRTLELDPSRQNPSE